jgi:hypothetical protein
MWICVSTERRLRVDDNFSPPEELASEDERRLARARGLQNAARFTAIAGIAYSLLFITSFWLLTNIPRSGSTDQEIVDYYGSDEGNVVTLVALYLMPFSGIAFLWFIVSLRMWVSTRVDRRVNALFSNIQLVSGIVFLALFFCAAAALSVAAVANDISDSAIDPEIAREFPKFGGSLLFVFAARMGAMFVFSTTNIGRATTILPTWFVIVGILVGLIMLLSASFNRALILVFPVWVLVLCLIILLHARQAARASAELERSGANQDEPPLGVPVV